MTKFLVDRMLGQTAKWLRLVGIDAKYAPECDDDKLLEMAEEEDRILITRDKDLKKKERVLMVEKAPPETIVKKVIEEYSIEVDPLSRCSKCNHIVEEIDKDRAKNEVPTKVYENNDVYWYCSKCDQYYWRGSHWDKIMNKIDKILE